MKRKLISIILKIIVIVSSFIGVILNAFSEYGRYIGSLKTFLYFTIQSNLWISIWFLLLLILLIIEKKKQKVIIKKWMYIVKYIFTVSITLTGMVYCFLLAPTAGEEFDTWSIHNVLTHIVVPLFSIIDLFMDKYSLRIENKNVFLVILPPLYYFMISLICYFNNVEFIEGQNYPYFFLNHSSPAKVFGFSNEPIYMGSFYWIVILLIFILSMGFLYKFIYNKVNNKKAD